MSSHVGFKSLIVVILIGCFARVSEARYRYQVAPSSNKVQGLSNSALRPLPSGDLSTVLCLRAGSDDEEEDGEEDDDDEEESGLEKAADSTGNDSSFVGFLIKGALETTKALLRAALAAFDFSEVQSDASIVQQATLLVQRMWKAAFSSSSSSSSPSSTSTKLDNQMLEKSKPPPTQHIDFGSYLGSSYGVDAGRDNLDEVEPILTSSLQNALTEARNQARLLVILIPANHPKKKDPADLAVIESFLSADVATVARRKAKKGSTRGSFVLWSSKAGSPEAALATKRLKAQTKNAKGQKRPILLVVYPNRVADSSGIPKIVPRLLAQHHCSPPPSSETMAAWLNALRKRHAKQYTTMQTEVRELELFQERKQGYKESVKTDVENKKKEAREEAERKALEEAEKKRAEEIRQRRDMLWKSLPEEPGASDTTAYTVALRLSDGRSGQRRFPSDSSTEIVFAWVDAHFEIEQETVTLTTMNGKVSLSWDDRDKSLEETGLPKKVGLRVMVTDDKTAESD